MSRKQWLRVCCNLLQMADTTQSPSARNMFRWQYEQLKRRLQRREQTRG
ncbi:hypothetical protein M5X00_29805 [Paenibacillus alvei]|nr:hypothetical protein [Paenibacillus alvei]EJW14172.1 hypothetical protein PAV_16c00090 [Paenibacillus alvei DSM 29]EJW14528.1 hypothetical protein PAV_13c01470 [Paenibacillus alvei DSM 29]MCY9540013.1 hypothetical protein [Paenibacillus alvei]MCY9708358.1 hypothetical protein [Paenibacillus alvei]MCY9738069.1 hypothetical protein [Paenibacillus alvei]